MLFVFQPRFSDFVSVWLVCLFGCLLFFFCSCNMRFFQCVSGYWIFFCFLHFSLWFIVFLLLCSYFLWLFVFWWLFFGLFFVFGLFFMWFTYAYYEVYEFVDLFIVFFSLLSCIAFYFIFLFLVFVWVFLLCLNEFVFIFLFCVVSHCFVVFFFGFLLVF